MKAYLVTTGTIFGLIAAMHLLKSIADWQSFGKNPGDYIAMAALGCISAAMSIWAWRLLWTRSQKRSL